MDSRLINALPAWARSPEVVGLFDDLALEPVKPRYHVCSRDAGFLCISVIVGLSCSRNLTPPLSCRTCGDYIGGVCNIDQHRLSIDWEDAIDQIEIDRRLQRSDEYERRLNSGVYSMRPYSLGLVTQLDLDL